MKRIRPLDHGEPRLNKRPMLRPKVLAKIHLGPLGFCLTQLATTMPGQVESDLILHPWGFWGATSNLVDLDVHHVHIHQPKLLVAPISCNKRRRRAPKFKDKLFTWS